MSLAVTVTLVLTLVVTITKSAVTPDYLCPQKCECRRALHQQSIIVDCADRGLQDIPANLDPATIHLDLSGNQIASLPTGAFDGLGSLATILLNDNEITTIQAHAFRGMGNVRVLDLQRNKLRQVVTDGLAGIHGAMDCSSTNPCAINLQGNPLRHIQSYAMAWCKGISLILGHSDTDLVIEPYAFYGAEAIPLIQISHIPSIRLQPRIFTNTDLVKILEISNTKVKILEGFTFEGLKNAQEIQFRDCEFGTIEEFGFSGILYYPSEISQVTTYNDRNQRAGGILNISGSTIPALPTDGFRDTNLEKLIFTNNQIDMIHGHAFRGLHSLALLELTANTITTLKPYAFGTLKNVPHVKLSENSLSHLASNAFGDSKGIHRLSLYVRSNTSMTLAAYSFSGLRDVGILDIKGAPGATFTVDKDAFHDLGGVTTLQISNVSIPTVGQHTFRGLNKVQTLRLDYCNISRIDGLAFGGPNGAVATIELKDGNNLPCDCQTNKLLRDFESRFAMFTASCQTGASTPEVLTPYTFNWPSCESTGAGNSVHGHSTVVLLLAASLFLVLR